MIWLSFAIMFGYFGFVICRFGIPKSISATYYLLGRNGWLFQFALALTAFTALPVLIDASSEETEFLAFLSCGGLLFVSAAPLFRLKFEGAVHYGSALVCCISLVLWQVFNTSWIVPLVAFSLVLIPMLIGKKYTWWLEIATISSAYVSLIVF